MTKTKYLIAFDMDGTLLNKNQKISFLTRMYLRKLTRKGYIILLASGRPSRALVSYHKELGLKTPFICYNGAYSFSLDDKNYPKKAYEFPFESIKSIYKELTPYILNVMCETDTDIYLDKEDKYLDKYFWYKDMNLHYGDLENILDKNPMTMIAHMYGEDKYVEEIDEIISKYSPIKVRYWTGSPYFELYYEETSKGASIKQIANYYGIESNHIICFGDAENDIDMFSALPEAIKVAMINGKPTLKEKADIVTTKDNNHNGIYYTLKQIIKNL